ncbi:MAG: chromosomal replication initiator protein DnaA [Rhodothermales bacterium]|nr:chromosomal replication initiator protein DnaA [Rhodothermales bacterium]
MSRTAEEVWGKCLDVIRDNVGPQSFETWFSVIRPVSLVEEQGIVKLTIQLPSRFYYEWLEEHYFTLLRKTVTRVLGSGGRLMYDIVVEKGNAETGSKGAHVTLPAHHSGGSDDEVEQIDNSLEDAPDELFDPSLLTGGPRYLNQPVRDSTLSLPGIRRNHPINSQLNPNYTFERFIEGDCNRLARSAALAIAKQPGRTSFNPFLIYGGVGLGKTHLIQAIGNYARAHNNVQSILYVSSERFTTEFVQAIQYNRVSEFSLFYRQIDLLVIDDAQFFGGKEKTQEEFFHIFNALHQSGKQIVLSADRSPRDIEGIEERLLSRFQWGLSADMQPPDLETRIAILQRKASDDGIAIDQDVIEFVGHNIKSNIRELEGALIRLLAFSTLNKRDLNVDLAREVLRDLIKETRITMSIDEIQVAVCDYFNLTVDLVCAKTRKREVVQARQIAMFFCKELTQNSLKTIGLHFGGRDHSTVIHANQSVMNQIETDPKYRQMIDEVRDKIDVRSR